MSNDNEAQGPTVQRLRLDPVPSQDPDDPLNWPLRLKIAILVQTSLLAAIGGLNTATINPAMLQLSREFGVDRVQASYQTTVCIALNGIAPWLWIPLAYKYGRRPVYLATTLLGFVSILGCAYTQTYTQLLVARIFNGLFPVGFALGATTVTDLFFFHQRGRAMGFFTVTVVNGAHVAPIIGGLLGQYSGWRWIFKFLAIVDAVLLVVAFFCLPETMYNGPEVSTETTQKLTARLVAPGHATVIASENGSNATLSKLQTSLSHVSTTTLPVDQPRLIRPRTKLQTYRYHLRLYSHNPDYKISYVSTITPTLRLFLSPKAIFPAIYYASMYGFASILPAVTVAAIFTEFFHWNTLQIGLSFGAALTIGGILGEFFAGWICDAVVKREQARVTRTSNRLQANDLNTPYHTTVVGIRPEVRLRPIWPGAILTPVGLLVYGFTLQYHTHPSLPLFGMALSCFGLQIITTCVYTYAIDCHTTGNKISTNIDATNQTVHRPAELARDNTSNTQNIKDGTNAATATQPPQISIQRIESSSSNLPTSTFTSSPATNDRYAQPIHPQSHLNFQAQAQAQSTPRPSHPIQDVGAAQVAQLFNFIRQMFGFTFAFYVVHMGERIGYHWTFTIFAFCGGVLAFAPVVRLILIG